MGESYQDNVTRMSCLPVKDMTKVPIQQGQWDAEARDMTGSEEWNLQVNVKLGPLTRDSTQRMTVPGTRQSSCVPVEIGWGI